MPGSIHWFDVDDVNLFLGAGNDKVTIDTTHAGTTDVDTAGGADQVAIRSISGDTSVLTQAGTDAISVGSNAGFWSEYTAQGVITVTRFISVNGKLDDIDALLTVNGGADVDALRLDDTGDSATDDNTGTLTLNTIRGLDMTEGVDYAAFESLNVDLGAGDDTFTIESTHASSDFERYTTVEGRGGDDKLYVKTTDSVTTVRGDGSETIGTHLVSTGEGTDFIKVGTLAPNSLGTLNEIVGLLTIDGGGGGTDLLWVDDTGDGLKNIGSLSSTTLAGLGMTLTPFGTRPGVIQVVTVRNAVDGRFQLRIGSQLTTELDWDATQDEVRAALEALPAVGTGNVTVSRVGDTYVVTYIGALAGQPGWDLAPLEAVTGAEFALIGTGVVLTVDRMTNGRLDYTGFEDMKIELGSARDVLSIQSTHGGRTTVNAGAGSDIVAIEGNDGPTNLNGQAGDDFITVNPVRVSGETNAIGDPLSIDGNGGSDTTIVNLFNDGESRLHVTDTAIDGASNYLIVNGTAGNDVFLLRRNMVAMMNTPTGTDGVFLHSERVSYDAGINAGVVVNAGAGDDKVAFDDTSSVVTVNGEDGDDLFQIGQIVGGRTNADGSVTNGPMFDVGQVVDTVGTTYGRLTNGVSFPATINGGRGNDSFSVFRNKGVLQLNGDQGDDEFVIRTFLLVDEYTNVNAGAGVDFVRYVMNAPVNIDGGEGFDRVIVIGTEANDLFVITADGVFGAGRYVGFINVEQLDVDGMEGDDTFIVQSTKAGVQTRIFGGLGSDTINVASDAPAVVANDLLGHSGLIEHIVLGGGGWTGTAVDGIAAEIVDDDEPAFVVRPVGGGGTLVDENGATSDAFTIVMTFAPTTDVVVTISRPAPSPHTDSIRSESVELSLDGVIWGPSVTLVFTPGNWSQLRTIHVRAIDDRSSEGELTIPLQSLVIGQLGGSVVAAAGTSVTVGAGALAGQSLLGRTLIVTAPDGTSQARTITGVSGSVITLESAFEVAPGAGSTWLIREIGNYNAFALNNIAVRLLDSDAAGVVILPGSGATQPAVGENGATTTYTIRLNRPGIGDVTVALQPLHPGQLGTSISAFTFAGATTSATISVSALDDPFREGFQFEHIGHALTTVDAFAGAVTAQSPRLDEVAGSFGTRDLRGFVVRITSGAAAGQWRYIRHNTATKLYLQSDLDVFRPAAGDTFVVQGYTAPASQSEIAGGVASASGTLITLTAALPGFVGLAGLTGAVLRIIDGGGPGVDVMRTIVASNGNTITVESPFTGDVSGKQFIVVDLQGVSIDRFTALVADDEAPGVRITETDGSTRLSEAGDSDSYFVGLTQAPTVEVRITIRPKQTPTLRDQDFLGQLRNDIQVTVDVAQSWIAAGRAIRNARRHDHADLQAGCGRRLERHRGPRRGDRRRLRGRQRPAGVRRPRAARVPDPGPAVGVRRLGPAGGPLDPGADHAAGRDAGRDGDAGQPVGVRARALPGRHAQRLQQRLDLRRHREPDLDAAHRPRDGPGPVRRRARARRRHHLRRARGAQHPPRPRPGHVHDRDDALRHDARHGRRPVRGELAGRRPLLRPHDRRPHDDRGHGRQRRRQRRHAGPASAAPGTIDLIAALLTIDGGAGDDYVKVDDAADLTRDLGWLTQTTLTGLDMIGRTGIDRALLGHGPGRRDPVHDHAPGHRRAHVRRGRDRAGRRGRAAGAASSRTPRRAA